MACCAQAPLWADAASGGAAALEDPEPSGPRYLRAYKESHYRSLGSDLIGTLDWDQFDERVANADVLFLGDHHFDQGLHDQIIRTITRLSDEGHDVAIGIEAIGMQDEAALAQYLSGAWSLDALRDAVRGRWPDSWLDHDAVDSAFYRKLLATARQTSSAVFALEPTPRLTLAERDAFIGKRIRAVRGLMPDRLLVVVIGHAHLYGQGRLAERTGLRSLAVCARLSRSLSQSAASLPIEAPEASRPRFVESDRGVLFFDPRIAARP